MKISAPALLCLLAFVVAFKASAQDWGAAEVNDYINLHSPIARSLNPDPFSTTKPPPPAERIVLSFPVVAIGSTARDEPDEEVEAYWRYDPQTDEVIVDAVWVPRSLEFLDFLGKPGLSNSLYDRDEYRIFEGVWITDTEKAYNVPDPRDAQRQARAVIKRRGIVELVGGYGRRPERTNAARPFGEFEAPVYRYKRKVAPDEGRELVKALEYRVVAKPLAWHNGEWVVCEDSLIEPDYFHDACFMTVREIAVQLVNTTTGEVLANWPGPFFQNN